MPPLFRLNPLVDVVPWRALSPEERDHVQRLVGPAAVAGVARPKTAGGTTVKAIDDATLALLESFRDAAPFAGCDGLASVPAFLERFVLDGFLEIEIDGRFVSGPAAMSVLGENDEATPVPPNRVAALSLESLRYAQSLPVSDPRILSARLYMYNAAPFGPRWESAFRDPERIAELLGVGPSGPNSAALAAGGYEAVDHVQWYAWTHRSLIRDGALRELPFKLYISPAPGQVAEVFSRSLPVLIRHAVGSLKIGRTAQNLLRPDKCIAYVETETSLRALERALEPLLRDFSAQGVPFTCGVDADGMLSWGSDPPRSLSFAGWAQAESWRACIADYLALGLVQARSHSHPEPWRFALRRTAAAGIDTTRWAPAKAAAHFGGEA